MKHFVYSVKDEKVAFDTPFYVQANARSDMYARNAVQKAYDKGVFGETYVDCTLYKIGTFDDVNGQHENYRFPEVILRVKDLKKGDEENAEMAKTV